MLSLEQIDSSKKSVEPLVHPVLAYKNLARETTALQPSPTVTSPPPLQINPEYTDAVTAECEAMIRGLRDMPHL